MLERLKIILNLNFDIYINYNFEVILTVHHR